jgi:hypothetical protein
MSRSCPSPLDPPNICSVGLEARGVESEGIGERDSQVNGIEPSGSSPVQLAVSI